MSADLQPRVVIEGVGEPVVLDATWKCGMCTFINLVEITQCFLCGFCDKSSKFDAASASDASYLTTSVDTSLISGITATPTSAEPWKCSFCDYFPCDASKHVCPVCETARQGAAPQDVSVRGVGARGGVAGLLRGRSAGFWPRAKLSSI